MITVIKRVAMKRGAGHAVPAGLIFHQPEEPNKGVMKQVGKLDNILSSSLRTVPETFPVNPQRVCLSFVRRNGERRTREFLCAAIQSRREARRLPGDPAKTLKLGTTVLGAITVPSAIRAQSLMMAKRP